MNTLDKITETAKKLRRACKKIGHPNIVDLIVELNLDLADLKMELAENRADQQLGTGHRDVPQQAHKPAKAPAPDRSWTEQLKNPIRGLE